MSTLTLPYAIANGAEENINHVMSNFRTIETWANNDIDDSNMASGYDITPTYNVDQLLYATSYGASGSGSPILFSRTNSIQSGVQGSATGVFYWNSSTYQIAGRTTYLRMQVSLCTGGSAPGQNFVFGLYPMTGSATYTVPAATAGTVVSNSTLTFTTPSLNTVNYGAIGFTAPDSGYYSLGVALGGLVTNGVTGMCRLGVYWI